MFGFRLQGFLYHENGEKLRAKVCCKFCFKLKKSPVDTYVMLKTAYGQDVMSNVTFYWWYNAFKDGRESVADEPRDGRPSMAQNEILVNTAIVIVRKDKRTTVRELATRLNIAIGSAFAILSNDLSIRRVSCRWIPRLFFDE